jgi:hypothetical protein
MRVGPQQKRALILLARRVETNLAAHVNAHGPPGVDPSHVATLLKYARGRPSVQELKLYLEALPRSALARYTAAAGPQLERTCREGTAVLRNLEGSVGPGLAVEAFAYVLGLVKQMLQTRERARPADRGGRS